MFWVHQGLTDSNKYPFLPFLPPHPLRPTRQLSEQKVASFHPSPSGYEAELAWQEMPEGTFLGLSSVPVPEAPQDLQGSPGGSGLVNPRPGRLDPFPVQGLGRPVRSPLCAPRKLSRCTFNFHPLSGHLNDASEDCKVHRQEWACLSTL